MQVNSISSVAQYNNTTFKSKIMPTENFKKIMDYYIERPYLANDFATSLKKILNDGKNRLLEISSRGFGTLEAALYEGRVTAQNKILSSTNGYMSGIFEEELPEDSLYYYDALANEEGFRAAADATNKFVTNDDASKKVVMPEFKSHAFDEIKKTLESIKKEIFKA